MLRGGSGRHDLGRVIPDGDRPPGQTLVGAHTRVARGVVNLRHLQAAQISTER